MESRSDFSLKSLNTFDVEARARRYVRFDEEKEISEFLGVQYFEGERLLVLGGGSNLLFVDDFDGIVLHPVLKGIDVLNADERYIRVRAMAGENWDELVAHAVASGWGGIENLSLIPGSVGASAVQNIGAYGVEVKDVIDSVEAIDIHSHEKIVFPAEACGFGYRTSHFKGLWTGRHIITAVVFRFCRQPRFVLDYPEVREQVDALGPVNLDTLRQAIIAIRRAKLPDPADLGNAGSFFKNPVVEPETLHRLQARFADLPRYPQPDGRVKLSAGWMIDRCGWKGRQIGRAGVHDRQALVLVNLGGATGREILDLSERVRRSVNETFDVNLEREVKVVP
ncbi:UDP-N-acetylenolpyruvoylglucosamine reductase [Desulfosarcina widdelii]|uniref:UDP-N-acetylenolpyruvoylglucosamine reductase n=1 Tax=Desulfosarcina widdelii TaxID=947919 RepID=A0A5K7Z4X5_9BACT|nr:UDP-N-acetylmuramate dehydrogenase [Desulfosarcina widdelii]BBO75750.1 UDP-N-acetylenolpyruvoylglucosamine reductase [Desulfosarcina widdelii]